MLKANCSRIVRDSFYRVAKCLIVSALFCLSLAVQLHVCAQGNAAPSNDVAANEVQNLKEDEVRFKNGDVVLAGTLLLPVAGGARPAIVIIHGSGPNEGSGYRVYGEQFARAGIAALLYDKRGSGKSKGEWRYRTLDDLTGDALAAVAYLKSRPEINAQQIGLWGISQGGWVVPLAASRSQDVAFVITVAGNGVSPTQQEMFHKDEMFRHIGYSERARDTALKFWKLIFDWLVLVADGKFPWPKGLMEPEMSGAYLGLNHDPVQDWEKVTQPALLIYGEEDKLTPGAEAIARIDAALKRAGNRDYTFVRYPKAAHNITTGKTGLEFDWDTGFAPGYFQTMNSWVLAHVEGRDPPRPEHQVYASSPSPDFESSGRYGPPPWHGRIYPQMGLIILFALVFLYACLAFIVKALKNLFRKQSSAPAKSVRRARRLVGLISGLNLALMIGFIIFIAQAIFLQGMNYMDAYKISTVLRALPLAGLLSTGLTIALLILTALAWKGDWSKGARLRHTLFVLVALAFIPWLSYWNLIGLWF